MDIDVFDDIFDDCSEGGPLEFVENAKEYKEKLNKAFDKYIEVQKERSVRYIEFCKVMNTIDCEKVLDTIMDMDSRNEIVECVCKTFIPAFKYIKYNRISGINEINWFAHPKCNGELFETVMEWSKGTSVYYKRRPRNDLIELLAELMNQPHPSLEKEGVSDSD